MFELYPDRHPVPSRHQKAGREERLAGFGRKARKKSHRAQKYFLEK